MEFLWQLGCNLSYGSPAFRRSSATNIRSRHLKAASRLHRERGIHFVNDCYKMVDAANPMKPELAGTHLKSINDAKGNPLFPDLDHFQGQSGSPRLAFSGNLTLRSDIELRT